MKDTTDLLRRLDAIKSVPDNAYVVSLDVKSLYKYAKCRGNKSSKTHQLKCGYKSNYNILALRRK